MIFVSFISGLTFGILLLIVTNYIDFLNNAGVILLAQFTAVITVGLVAGSALKGKISHSYLVSVFALLYTYAAMALAGVTAYIHYTLYVLLATMILLGAFQLGNKFFNHSGSSKRKRVAIAIVGFVFLLVICSIIRQYVIRAVVSATYN